MEICVDEYGYIYILEPSGAKRYILVDMPNCQHYGKLKLGKEDAPMQCIEKDGAELPKSAGSKYDRPERQI